DARKRVPGHAPLHPMRRLPQSLPGLRCDRWACLWVGLSRANGCRADAGAEGHRSRARSSQRIELVRTLRGGLPHEHPAAEDAAGVAGARLRQERSAVSRTDRAKGLGICGEAARALSCACRTDHAAARLARRAPWPVLALAIRHILDEDA